MGISRQRRHVGIGRERAGRLPHGLHAIEGAGILGVSAPRAESLDVEGRDLALVEPREPVGSLSTSDVGVSLGRHQFAYRSSRKAQYSSALDMRHSTVLMLTSSISAISG